MARSSSGRRGRRRRQGRSTPGARPTPATAGANAGSTAATPAADPGIALRPRRSAPRPAAEASLGRQRSRIYRWTHPRIVLDIASELRKVVWPSRYETRNLTTVVLVVSIAVGAILGVVDWIFNRLLENVLLR